MKVGYSCNLWKSLHIGAPKGKEIKFEGGLFETDDEELQGIIESNDQFTVNIHWVDDPTPARERANAEAKAAEEARERKRVLDEMAAQEKADKESAKTKAAEETGEARKGKLAVASAIAKERVG